MRHSSALVVFVVVLACSGGDSPTGPGAPAPALVVTVPASFGVGLIVQATVSGATTAVTWSSSNPSVAVVESDGSVTGINAGTATISAVSGAAAGSALVTVTPAPILLPGTSLLTLRVGGAAVLTPSLSARGWGLPAGGDYIVIAANANSSPDVVAPFGVVVDGSANGASVAPASSPSRGRMAAEDSPWDLERRSRAHMLECDKCHELPRSVVAAAFPRPSAAVIPADVKAGDLATVRFRNFVTHTTATVTAQVRVVTAHSVFLADTGTPSGGFSSADYESLASEFETVTYPVSSAYFGTPSDQDGNNRVVMLFTPEVNKLSPRGTTGYYGGFFDVLDLLPASSAPGSNEAEILYFAVPDPAGAIGPTIATAQLRQQVRGFLAHELQHMINAGNRLALGGVAAGFEEGWLNEGLSHLAEDLVGRAANGFGSTERLTWATVRKSQPTFEAFFLENLLLRFGSWATEPAVFGANTAQSATSGPRRGAIWSLLRRAVDFHTNNPQDLTRKLSSGPLKGIANVVSATGTPWDVLVTEWLIANVADGLAGSSGGPNGYRSYDLRDVATALHPNDPLFVKAQTLTGPGLVTGTVVSGSGAYYSIRTTEPRLVRLTSPAGTTPASFEGARMIVVRIK